LSLIQGRMDNMKKKKGQSMVEIALALPLLVFLLCGIIDFGRILYAGETLNLINQEAVRKAGLGKTNAEVTEYVKNNCPLADKDTIVVAFNPTSQPRSSGTYVTVTLKYEVKYITPVMKFIIGDTFTINNKSTIRVE